MSAGLRQWLGRPARAPAAAGRNGFADATRARCPSHQIHALAHKGKKAACHSDNVENPDEAKVVQINTLRAHGVTVNESGLLAGSTRTASPAS